MDFIPAETTPSTHLEMSLQYCIAISLESVNLVNLESRWHAQRTEGSYIRFQQYEKNPNSNLFSSNYRKSLETPQNILFMFMKINCLCKFKEMY